VGQSGVSHHEEQIELHCIVYDTSLRDGPFSGRFLVNLVDLQDIKHIEVDEMKCGQIFFDIWNDLLHELDGSFDLNPDALHKPAQHIGAEMGDLV
jgi:hypothetical protein